MISASASIWGSIKDLLFGAPIKGGLGCDNRYDPKPEPIEEEPAPAKPAKAEPVETAPASVEECKCKTSQIVPYLALQQMLVLGSKNPGEISFPDVPLVYTDDAANFNLPQECKLTVAEQELPAQVIEGEFVASSSPAIEAKEGIVLIPIKSIPITVIPEGSITINETGEYPVGLVCGYQDLEQGFSMQAGTLTIEDRVKKPSGSKKKKIKIVKEVKETPKENNCNSMQKSMAILEAMNDGTMTKGKKCKVVNGKVVWK